MPIPNIQYTLPLSDDLLLDTGAAFYAKMRFLNLIKDVSDEELLNGLSIKGYSFYVRIYKLLRHN